MSADRGPVDALLVTTRANVRYLTGFDGSAGAALVRADGSAELAVDARYETEARASAPGVPVHVTRSYASMLVSAARAAGLTRIAFEAHSMSVEAYELL